MAADEDESEAFAKELAPHRATLGRLIADLRAIKERRPKHDGGMHNAIGLLEEADEMLEDLPNNEDGPAPHIAFR